MRSAITSEMWEVPQLDPAELQHINEARLGHGRVSHFFDWVKERSTVPRA